MNKWTPKPFIYISCEFSDPTQLLKKCQKKQKWTSQWQTILSLKGITLVRLGKEAYAIELANEVAASQPNDEQAVQLCANVYRDAHRPEAIPGLYENAIK